MLLHQFSVQLANWLLADVQESLNEALESTATR